MHKYFFTGLLGLVFVLGFETSEAAEDTTEAFYIQPMEFHIHPDSKATSTLEVFNKEDHEAKIHVDVFERSDSAEGAEKRVLTKDVSLDQSDFRIPAGGTHKIQLTYRGSKKPSRERAFRIVVRQITANEEASLDVRFVYVASMYVTPKLAQSKVTVEKVSRVSDREFEVTLMNVGRAHARMSELVFELLHQEKMGRQRKVEVSTESLETWAKQNLLAGGRRKLTLQIGPNERPVIEGKLSLNVLKRSAH